MKPTKLIKGQGLAKLLAESNYKALGINQISDRNLVENQNKKKQSQTLLTEPPYQKIDSFFVTSYWYVDIIYYLHNLQLLGYLDT
jgi:hypothetical protein